MWCKSLETSAIGFYKMQLLLYYLLYKAAGTLGNENKRANYDISPLGHIIPVCLHYTTLQISNFHHQCVLPKYLLCWKHKNSNVLKNSDT